MTFAVALPCPRCGARIAHGFRRLAVPGNLGADPCPSCGAPLRFPADVREYELACLVVFAALIVAAILLFRACAACVDLDADLPGVIPRVAIIATGLIGWPIFTAVERRVYFGWKLARAEDAGLLEVFDA